MIPQHAPVRQNDHHQLQFTAAVTTPQRWQWFRLFPRGKPQQKKQSQRHTRQPADFLNIDLPSRMLPAVSNESYESRAAARAAQNLARIRFP